MLWRKIIIIALAFCTGKTLTIGNTEVKVTCSDLNGPHGRSQSFNIEKVSNNPENSSENYGDPSSTTGDGEQIFTDENETVITRALSEATTLPVSSNSSEELTYLDAGSEIMEVFDSTIVKTEYGYVQGYYKHESTDILSFFDIPYGNYTRRFAAPRYAERWEGIHTVDEHEKRCPQYAGSEVIGSLDCLTLSIFTPQNVTNAKVLFHIHDGNFDTGSGDDSIYGPRHLVPKGIILVLPNYRLGALGFLCLRNQTAPGNAALKDLTLALDWTRRNIEAFGGDPYDITVSGEGSGGALAMYLALSPKSNVYISKVITESGTALSHWALDRRPIATAFRLAGIMHMNTGSTGRLHEVFENVDLETLITTSKGLEFMPCIENSAAGFITESPWRILNRYQNNITFMIGTANHAGVQEALEHTNTSVENLNNDISSLLPTDLHFRNPEERSEITQEVKQKYFSDTDNITMELFENLTLFYTDISYTVPVIRTVGELVDSGVSVYLYEFSFVGDLNREEYGLTSLLNSAAKGDIIGYTFCQDQPLPDADSDEKKMVDLVTDLWVSFMKTGIPAGDNIIWNKVNQTRDHQEEWLSIGSVVTSETGLHPERMKLWTDIYDKYYIERNRSFNLKHDGLYFFMVGFVLFDVYVKI